jgi:hypothetical protein
MLCHKACLDKLGYTPIGFRIPHFGAQFTPSIYSILKKIGYVYDSSKISLHAGNPNPYCLEVTSGITEFPMSSCPLHPFDLFDTWHSLNRGPKHHNNPGEFYGMFLELVKMAEKNGAYVNFYIDPQDVQDNADFIKMLKYLQTNKEMVKTYRELLTLC